jgi:hypothetical protein
MAIIYSYPEKTSPAGGDFLVITDSEQRAPKKNRTKSLTIDNLASYISTSTSGITGGGTVNTIAMFTPDGQKIGDSRITQQAIGAGVTVNTNLIVTDYTNIQGNLLTDSLEVSNDSSFNGEAIFGGDIEVTGDATFESEITINGPLYDQSGSTGAAGQLLTSTSQGVDWDDATDVVSGAVAKLIPYVTTATPGGSETYTALNNIVKIGWSGGNGIYVLNLPSATAIPYRNIRFVTNGTYPGGGAHKLRFTPPVGETIDGNSYFEISKAYEGISIWSTGTEWVVIQAKAH